MNPLVDLPITVFDGVKTSLKEAGLKRLVSKDGRRIDVGGVTFSLVSPHKDLDDSHPVVLYFWTRKEAEDFVKMVKAAQPGLKIVS